MIELPDWAVPNGAEPFFLDMGGVLSSGMGEDQRLNRLGNRFGFAAAFPPAPSAREGRILVSRLIRAKSEGLRLEFPLLDFKPGSPGAPVVDGAGQAGTTLNVRGFTPHYAVREGAWFTHIHAGRGYLYNIAGGVIADASGVAAVPIAPMLRVEPADGDALNFARPTIEGLVWGDEWRWQMSLERNIGIEIEVRERA